MAVYLCWLGLGQYFSKWGCVQGWLFKIHSFSCNKNEQNIAAWNNMDESHWYNIEQKKKKVTQEYILYDSNFNLNFNTKHT